MLCSPAAGQVANIDSAHDNLTAHCVRKAAVTQHALNDCAITQAMLNWRCFTSSRSWQPEKHTACRLQSPAQL